MSAVLLKVSKEVVNDPTKSEQLPLSPRWSTSVSDSLISTMKIQFSLEFQGFVQIKILNAEQIEVQTLVNDYLTAGLYECEWDTTAHPRGQYYYQIRVGKYTVNKKILLS